MVSLAIASLLNHEHDCFQPRIVVPTAVFPVDVKRMKPSLHLTCTPGSTHLHISFLERNVAPQGCFSEACLHLWWKSFSCEYYLKYIYTIADLVLERVKPRHLNSTQFDFNQQNCKACTGSMKYHRNIIQHHGFKQNKSILCFATDETSLSCHLSDVARIRLLVILDDGTIQSSIYLKFNGSVSHQPGQEGLYKNLDHPTPDIPTSEELGYEMPSMPLLGVDDVIECDSKTHIYHPIGPLHHATAHMIGRGP